MCHSSLYVSATSADTIMLSADQFSDSDGTTILVKGFDRYLGEDAVREQLTAAFAHCGAVSTVRLPTESESGELKGIGFIEFATTEAKVSQQGWAAYLVALAHLQLKSCRLVSRGVNGHHACHRCGHYFVHKLPLSVETQSAINLQQTHNY